MSWRDEVRTSPQAEAKTPLLSWHISRKSSDGLKKVSLSMVPWKPGKPGKIEGKSLSPRTMLPEWQQPIGHFFVWISMWMSMRMSRKDLLELTKHMDFHWDLLEMTNKFYIILYSKCLFYRYICECLLKITHSSQTVAVARPSRRALVLRSFTKTSHDVPVLSRPPGRRNDDLRNIHGCYI